MKKISLLLAAIALAISTLGQQDMNSPIPRDSSVRYGKLPNGLTYYVWHNAKPKNRCEFRIAQDVGAILEEDNQNGLAHFLEHMCFNGTEHFPDKTIINYFESVGVSFGGGINASTSLDRTVYKLSGVPTTRETILDSALLVLYDWSCGVLLHDSEIENERGVIREEWRTGNKASRRISTRSRLITMPGSQYAIRNVIGDTAVINNFKPQTLRDFYSKWYGPDLQAIIVVGDIDVDKMEQKIISLFSSARPRLGLAPRTRYGVPDNEKPIVGVVLDPEAQSQSITIAFKHPHPSPEYVRSFAARAERAKRSLIMGCLETRLKDKYGTGPFYGIFPVMECGYYNLAGTTDQFCISVDLENGKEKRLYRDMCAELERIKRFGILKEELDLEKKSRLASLRRSLKRANDKESSSLVSYCISDFLSDISITSDTFDLDFYEKFVSNVTVAELNDMIKGFFNEGDRNMFIIAKGKAAPDKNGVGCSECDMPTEDELLSIYLASKDSALDPPTFSMKECKLVAKEPEPGHVVSKKHIDILDATEFTLSNDVKVVVKKTDFDINRISLAAESFGGYALYPVKDILNARYAGDIVRKNGYGSLTPLEQNKLLADKNVGISGAYISRHGEYLGAYSTTDDFGTMLQLVYLGFTAPRYDEKLFKEFIDKKKSDIASDNNNPKNEFFDRLDRLSYGNSERYIILDTNNLKQINQKRALHIYKERFANPADFTFYIIGDINIDDPATIADIEKWLGGLSTTRKRDKIVDDGLNYIRGQHTDYYKHTMKTKTATNRLKITGYGFDYSLRNIVVADLIEGILSTRYLESIREKEGGSYGVSVTCYVAKYNMPYLYLGIGFDTDPDKQNRLMNIVYDEIEKIISDGPLESDLAKEKEILLNKYEESLRNNYRWSSYMQYYYEYGFNYINDYVNIVNSITGDDIRHTLKKLYEQRNIIEAVLMPTRW